jgi:hypothetical protein
MKAILIHFIFAFSLSIFIPTIIGFFTYVNMGRPLRILYIYTVFSSIIGFIVSLMSMNTINNIYLVNINTVIGYIFLSSVYFNAFKFKIKRLFWIHITSILLVVLFYLYKAIGDIWQYNNELNFLVSFFLIFLSVVYLISEFRKADPGPFSKQLILISFGVFMYYSSSFLIVFVGSTNASMPEMQTIIIYLIHSIFYLIFVITLTIAFWLCRKPSEHLN